MEKLYVYFISFSYPTAKSTNSKRNLLTGIPIFGNCEVALEKKIEGMDQLRSIRDELKKGLRLKDLKIINFQLLREEKAKPSMAQLVDDRRKRRKK